MGNIIGTVKSAVAGLTGVAVCLITLGVVMESVSYTHLTLQTILLV